MAEKGDSDGAKSCIDKAVALARDTNNKMCQARCLRDLSQLTRRIERMSRD